MGSLIDLARVRSAHRHLERAKELDPTITERPVPILEIIAMEKYTYSVQEISEIVGVHPHTIRRAIAGGELKAANGGGKSPYRISRPDAEAWWRARGGGALFPPTAGDPNSLGGEAAGE